MLSEAKASDRGMTIQLIRIISALAVFPIHLWGNAPSKPAPLVIIGQYGQDGLWVFYIIAGYLAFTSYEHSDGTIDYYKKRAARLLPAYYTISIIVLALTLLNFTLMPPEPFGWLKHFLCLNQILCPRTDYGWGLLTVATSTSVFVSFYLLVLFLHKKVNSSASALGLLLVSMFIRLFSLNVLPKLLVLIGRRADTAATFSGVTLSAAFFYFVIGIVIHFIIKENKPGMAVFSPFALYNEH